MITAPQPEAADAGADILRAGGNAVDAAIACAFVQGVIDPLMCGVAGFGSMAIYVPGRHHGYVDFHAPAPAAARPEMWQDLIRAETRDGFGFILEGQVNDLGYGSVAMPASLRAYETAHRAHGRLPWSEIIQPAIGYAESGWTVRPHVHWFWSDDGEMGRAPNHARIAFSRTGRALYCRADGTPKRVGDQVVNRDLGQLLRLIARDGADTFYTGEIAHRIAEDMKSNGGLISVDDLAALRPRLNDPVWGEYRGLKVSTNHPPGGGVMLMEMLNILENFDLAGLGHNSTEYLRVVSETMKRVTSDKDQYIGDPAFLSVPIERLASKAYASEMVDDIRSGKRATVTRLRGGFPTKDTTHLSVVDKDGLCVSMTHSLGQPSGVITDGLGFMYNGCMAVFDPRPGHANSMAPGKARFSSICPSILFRDGRPYLVIGAPGATQIAMGVLQAILNVVDFGMTMTEAVSAPRFSSTSDAIDVSNRISRHVTDALQRDGYDIIRSPYGFGFAAVHGIRLLDDRLDGGADPGHDGVAFGVAL
ncbi:gamma-glutamyltransferase [Bradyrhizobium sp. AZCC 2262]|uniref:gamma-glutamyltransferase n=1 Tax=Bradyrhizobium sp. AZCC 2262 TaxID=3117022 RepID=UPI002FF270BA